MRGRLVHLIIFLAVAGVAIAPARAGHESPFYPSFYPQEITIERLDPATAARLLGNNSLHAYVGGDPFAGGTRSPNVSGVDSLKSYLVLTFNTSSKAVADRAARCAAAAKIVSAFRDAGGPFVFHPYPVTPYHADYLPHFDLAISWKARYQNGRPESAPPIGVNASGTTPRQLIAGRWPLVETNPDATVEEIDLDGLLASQRSTLNGWLGPPWLKHGWFHAYLLLAETLTDQAETRAVATLFGRLTSGPNSLSEHFNAERDLVRRLLGSCARVVIGYTVRREYANVEYSAGVENFGHDSHTGFNSAIFTRTVKLKDFPWNGWLRVGVAEAATAAWNPIAGFTDPMGRLIWSALDDPAFMPSPGAGDWIPNRLTSMVESGPAGAVISVPAEALRPEMGTGLWRPVGPGQKARVKIVSRGAMSSFHDGTKMTVADILDSFSFAYRWSSENATAASRRDAEIERATATMRGALVGLRVLGVETDVKNFGEDLKFTYAVPVVEAYLNANPPQAAAVAPPWSTLPWHVVALMEEAVKRNFGAFSQADAKHRRVEWLDLARSKTLNEKLRALVDTFKRQGYVPDSLKPFAKPDEARQRWENLKQFYGKYGHFLVTNGPYRLEKWSNDAVVLAVFRDLSYPLGVGAFDRYAIPLRAYISALEDRGTRLTIRAEVETVSRAARTYEIVREPLRGKNPAVTDAGGAVECRYVAVATDGSVRFAGVASASDDGTFSIDLAGKLTPGVYTVIAGLDRGQNLVNPDIRMVQYRVRP